MTSCSERAASQAMQSRCATCTVTVLHWPSNNSGGYHGNSMQCMTRAEQTCEDVPSCMQHKHTTHLRSLHSAWLRSLDDIVNTRLGSFADVSCGRCLSTPRCSSRMPCGDTPWT